MLQPTSCFQKAFSLQNKQYFPSFFFRDAVSFNLMSQQARTRDSTIHLFIAANSKKLGSKSLRRNLGGFIGTKWRLNDRRKAEKCNLNSNKWLNPMGAPTLSRNVFIYWADLVFLITYLRRHTIYSSFSSRISASNVSSSRLQSPRCCQHANKWNLCHKEHRTETYFRKL